MTMEMTKAERIGRHCARHLGERLRCAAVAAADANREYASEMDKEKRKEKKAKTRAVNNGEKDLQLDWLGCAPCLEF